MPWDFETVAPIFLLPFSIDLALPHFTPVFIEEMEVSDKPHLDIGHRTSDMMGKRSTRCEEIISIRREHCPQRRSQYMQRSSVAPNYPTVKCFPLSRESERLKFDCSKEAWYMHLNQGQAISPLLWVFPFHIQ